MLLKNERMKFVSSTGLRSHLLNISLSSRYCVIRTELRSDLVKKSTLWIFSRITLVIFVRACHQEGEAPTHRPKAVHELFNLLSSGHCLSDDMYLKMMIVSRSIPTTKFYFIVFNRVYSNILNTWFVD